MKLLLDQNLSHRLVEVLADVYPNCVHVRTIGMNAASDTIIWEYGKQNGYMIVSKDADFRQRSFLLGYPPKVVWIRRGNCTTSAIATILRTHVTDIEQFEADIAAAMLVLL